MLIWLGKALLNQRDQPETANNQHTNIVVTSDLLKNLQHSYHNTLADFRNSRNHLDSAGANAIADHNRFSSSKPDIQPALTTLEYVPRGTVNELSSEQESDSEPVTLSGTILKEQAQPTEQQYVSHDTQPITSHNSDSIQSRKALSESEQPSESETRPPVPAPPTRTPTPTPKRLTSHVSEEFEKGKESYKVGKLRSGADSGAVEPV